MKKMKRQMGVNVTEVTTKGRCDHDERYHVSLCRPKWTSIIIH